MTRHSDWGRFADAYNIRYSYSYSVLMMRFQIGHNPSFDILD